MTAGVATAAVATAGAARGALAGAIGSATGSTVGAAAAGVITLADAVTGVASGVRAAGSFRIQFSTGGCGATLATSSSTPRLLLCSPADKTLAWFSVVNTFLKSFNVVKFTVPLSSLSRMTGNRRESLAAVIRK